MGTVAVITDSASSLPADVAARHGIVVVPLHVIINGVERAEDAHLKPADVADALHAGARVTTSHPSPEAFVRAYQDAAEAGADAVVAVVLSGGLSGTVNAAQQGASRVAIDVRVVDTQQVGMAVGFAAVAAAQQAAAGAGVDAVVGAAEDAARGARVYFTVDSLEHLKRGGRISPAAAAVGTMLHVRPVLTMTDGLVTVAQKVRTSARARETVVTLAHRYADQLDDAVWAVHTVSGLTPPELAGVTALPVHVSAVLAAHTGPTVLAVAVAPAPQI